MLNTQILVGLYYCDEEIDALELDHLESDEWWKRASMAFDIAADWMMDAGATADDVARVAAAIKTPGAWCPLRSVADRVAGVIYRRENPQLEAEYDAAFAHLNN